MTPITISSLIPSASTLLSTVEAPGEGGGVFSSACALLGRSCFRGNGVVGDGEVCMRFALFEGGWSAFVAEGGERFAAAARSAFV